MRARETLPRQAWNTREGLGRISGWVWPSWVGSSRAEPGRAEQGRAALGCRVVVDGGGPVAVRLRGQRGEWLPLERELWLGGN